MSDKPERREQFAAEIAEMKVKAARPNRDKLWIWCGVVLMVAGIVIAFASYSASTNVQATAGRNVDILNSNSYTTLAIAGLAVSVVGGFVFLRYSLAQFLRFWLLRQIYEQRVAIDEVSGSRGS